LLGDWGTFSARLYSGCLIGVSPVDDALGVSFTSSKVGPLMEQMDEVKLDAMGKLHNQFVELVDGTSLSPPEMIVVLRMLVNHIEQQFEKSVKGD